MLEQYVKTFWGMQAVIALVTLAVFFGLNRIWSLAALFFVVMQASALLGAMWAARLSRKRRGVPA